MPQNPKSWEFDEDQTWPSELPKKLTKKLQEDVDRFVDIAAARNNAVAASRMKREAMQIAVAAGALGDAVRKFSAKHCIAIYENCRNKAAESLSDDLKSDELEMCRSGMNQYSLQWPLLGLIAYMNELAKIPEGNSGPPRVDIELAAVKEIICYFGLLNLDGRKGESGLLFRTCQVFFQRASKQLTSRGVKGNRARLKSDEAISKYLTTAAKT